MPAVKAELAKYGFVDGEYRNVIVTWGWTPRRSPGRGCAGDGASGPAGGRDGAERPGTWAEARARVADAAGFLATVGPDEFDAAADMSIAQELPTGMIFDMTGEQYVRDWALPQVAFHPMKTFNSWLSVIRQRRPDMIRDLRTRRGENYDGPKIITAQQELARELAERLHTAKWQVSALRVRHVPPPPGHEDTLSKLELISEEPTDTSLPMPTELDWKRELRRRR